MYVQSEQCGVHNDVLVSVFTSVFCVCTDTSEGILTGTVVSVNQNPT